MPNPTAPRYRITLGGTIGGQPWNSSVMTRASSVGALSFSDLIALAASIGAAFNTRVAPTWKTLNDAGTLWDSVRLDYYAPGSNASAINAVSTGFAIAGTNSGTSAASQSLCVSLYTALTS